MISALSAIFSAEAACLSERSFQLDADQTRRLASAQPVDAPTTRAWLRTVHDHLRDLLPTSAPAALLTEELVAADGAPVDVFRHFGLRQDQLQSLLGNLAGIRCTAQAAARDYHIDQPAPPWPGFEDIWIPVREGLALSARLGWAHHSATVRDADAIVLLPGLFGDNGVQRTRDLAIFLRDTGHHVLALEIRGHGQTEGRYPDACHTFGVIETDELMLVSDWLTQQKHVQRTGLIGFCWSANIALLAAWYDAREPHDPAISPAIAAELIADPAQHRFSAGIIAFSPILRWEELLDALDTPRPFLSEPVYSAIQDTVRDRMVRKNYPEKSGNLRNLIEYDFLACGVPLPGGVREGYPFLRLLPYRGEPCTDKLDRARVPVLVVHGCNDPLAPAQSVADLVSRVHNPLVAAMVLPGGGHVGFAAYAKQYYCSLVANYFDPTFGPAAETSRKYGPNVAVSRQSEPGVAAASP